MNSRILSALTIMVIQVNYPLLSATLRFRIEAAIPPFDDPWTLIPDPSIIRAKGWPKSTRIGMRWIGSNPLSTDKNAVDVEPKGITGVAVQCNMSVRVVQIVDLCMLVE